LNWQDEISDIYPGPGIKHFAPCGFLLKDSHGNQHRALNSAEVHDAEIHILYVLKYFFPLLYGFLAVSTPEDEKPAILDQIRKRLDDFVQRELENNPARINRDSSIQVIEGEPVVEILKKADEIKADVLIMGTHSKGLVSQTFLGSVATDVLQHSRVPVFIIPIPKA